MARSNRVATILDYAFSHSLFSSHDLGIFGEPLQVRMENERVQRLRVRNGEAEAHAARRMSEASTQATADAAATAAAAMALQQRTTVARPVGMTVVGAQRLPLIGAGEGGLGSGWTLETLQGSDMFLVVAALPQPLPPHVLVGHQQSDTAAEKQPAYVRRQQEAEEKERQQQLAQQGAAAAGGGGDAGSSSSSSEAAVQLAAAFSAPAQSVLRDANAPKVRAARRCFMKTCAFLIYIYILNPCCSFVRVFPTDARFYFFGGA